MFYYIKYYINNPNYHTIDYQKTFKIFIDNNEWINTNNVNNIIINEDNDNKATYIIIKYETMEDYNNIVGKYSNISTIDDIPYFSLNKDEKKNMIVINLA